MIDALIKLWELGYERVCIEFCRNNILFILGLSHSVMDVWETENPEKSFFGANEWGIVRGADDDFGKLMGLVIKKYPIPHGLMTPVGEKENPQLWIDYLNFVELQVVK